jgi:hypothetical protein
MEGASPRWLLVFSALRGPGYCFGVERDSGDGDTDEHDNPSGR